MARDLWRITAVCTRYQGIAADVAAVTATETIDTVAAALTDRPGPDGESDELAAQRTTARTVITALSAHATALVANAKRGRLRAAARLAATVSSGEFYNDLSSTYRDATPPGPLADTLDSVRLAGYDAETLLDALVRHEAGRHLGLVRHQANRVVSKYPGYEPEALFGMGWAGLIVALYKYDPTNSAFSTFAAIKIRGNIADMVRAESPIPKRLHTWYRKVGAAYEELSAALERAPTDDEVAQQLTADRLAKDLGRAPTLEEVADQLDAERKRMTILPRLSVPEELPADDSFANSQFDDPQLSAELDHLRSDVRAAIMSLPPAERDVVQRVELMGVPIDEVAETLGVTARQVRTIRETARGTLAAKLSQWAPAGT